MIYLYLWDALLKEMVLGSGTPNVSANELLKSSALHQNGLFITLVPVKSIFLGKLCKERPEKSV
jgi:hypothetical protein